ncbi:hypothetical protein K2224_12355 [Streptomyces sp. BHT-5-2]|uniref:hypothetical protein n=1 Tax=unclassified Streptomyces TaxID=2593676 RepID=UPI001C8D3F33|nr:hypothetical protein [Streptomyces sp. BHT-5-2]QZL03890.1 hypothetical protein K2224_12355 [Streptomyces sp. BHT-5-2]
MSEQTETTAGASLAASEAVATLAASETAQDPADGGTAPETEALQGRVRELEEERDRLAAERAERDRADAMVAVVRRYHYVTQEIVQALPEDFPADRLEAVACAINQAMHTAHNPPGIGRGGLTPSEERRATWDGLFRSAL